MEPAEPLGIGLFHIVGESPDEVNDDEGLTDGSELAEIVEVGRLDVEEVNNGIDGQEEDEYTVLEGLGC